MGKKAGRNAKESATAPDAANRLPQNILGVGERVFDNKNIYMLQSVHKAIAKFTESKTTDESGGVLVGHAVEELGKMNIVISGFIEAKYCESTPTTMKFTHQTWEYCHGEMDRRFKGQKIVGWIHTHPDFGIFLSEYDKFIQQNFFNEDYQVAYVIDPIQKSEGFFYWMNGRIERCAGFYVYDEVGKRITLPTRSDSAGGAEPEHMESLFSTVNIAVAVLCLLVAVLLVCVVGLNTRANRLQTMIEQVYRSDATQADLSRRMQVLEAIIAGAPAPQAEPTTPPAPAKGGGSQHTTSTPKK